MTSPRRCRHCGAVMPPQAEGLCAACLLKAAGGAGDFIGFRGKPLPLSSGDIERLLGDLEGRAPDPEAATSGEEFKAGDRVAVEAGPFEGFEGVVDGALEDGPFRVIVAVFGRPTPGIRTSRT